MTAAVIVCNVCGASFNGSIPYRHHLYKHMTKGAKKPWRRS